MQSGRDRRPKSAPSTCAALPCNPSAATPNLTRMQGQHNTSLLRLPITSQRAACGQSVNCQDLACAAILPRRPPPPTCLFTQMPPRHRIQPRPSSRRSSAHGLLCEQREHPGPRKQGHGEGDDERAQRPSHHQLRRNRQGHGQQLVRWRGMYTCNVQASAIPRVCCALRTAIGADSAAQSGTRSASVRVPKDKQNAHHP